ncbi:MAG: V-type ATP synthase subunit F [Thermoplasmatota archaeon]
MTKELGVVGSDDFCIGFELAGVRKVWVANTPDAFAASVEKLFASASDVGIVILDAKDVEHLPATLKRRVTESVDPVVVQMGSEGGDLREKIKRAIGIDLFKD